MAFTPGSGAVIAVSVDGAAASTRDVNTIGDALNRLNDSSLKRLNGQVDSAQSSISGLRGTIGDVIKMGLAGLSVAAFAGWIKGGIDAADAMDEIREKTGLLIEDVAGMRLIFEREGFGDKELVASMSRLSTGIVSGNTALEALSIKVKTANGAFRSTQDVMYDVADQFAGMVDGPQKAALAIQLFGKSGADLIPMLNGGSAGMREMAEMADRLGLTVDTKTAAAAGKFNDTLFLMQKGTEGVATRLAAELLPTLTSLTGSFLTSMTAGDKLARTAQVIGGAFRMLYTVGIGIVEVFSTVGKTIGAAGAQLVAVLSGDFKMAAQIGLEWQKDVGEGWASTAKAISDAWSTEGNAVVEAQAGMLNGQEDLLQKQKEREAAAKKSRQEYSAQVKSSEDFVAALKLEAAQLDLTEAQIKMMAAERAAAKAPNAELRNAILSEAAALEKAKSAWSALDVAKKLAADALDESNSDVNEINAQTSALLHKIKTYGMLPAAITAVQIAELESSKQSLVLTDAGVADIQRRIDALRGLADAQSAEGKLDAGSDVTKAKELLDIMVALDDATKSAATNMAASFGRVGSAIGGLTVAMSGYVRAQAGIAAQLAASKKDAGGDQVKIQRANAVAAQMSAQVQVRSYGDMAGAAKDFFKENTVGYRVMEGAEKAFRAAEMAMAVETMLTKSGLTTAFTSLFVASKATEVTAETTKTGISTTLAGTEASAWGITAVVKAIASMPFPANLAAGAATLAAVVAIGAKIIGGIGGGGSGGGMSAADAQKAQGTGGVFGDKDAKTDSIMKSLEMLESHSDSLLPINRGMLSALRNIEASMTGLTNLLVRTPGVVDGTNMGIATGTSASSGLATATSKFFGGFGPMGEIMGKLASSIFGKTTKSIVDSGIQFGGSVNALQAGDGYNQYASVDTTKKSLFGLIKKTSNSVETQGLSDELSTQFGLIFTNLENALTSAAVGMGIGAAQVASVLDSLTIATTSISLKGLTGQDLTDALNGVISKTMDEMASAVFPEMEQYRQVGEGYAETVIRIASNYANLDATLNSIGMTFGQVGLGSLDAREHLIMLSGGLDKLSEQASGFAENFLSEAERLAPVQKHVTEQLASLGYSSVKTRDDFKGAVLGLQEGGLLVTKAGAETFAGLMAIASAFAMVTPELKISTAAAEERASLERQIFDLTHTSAEILIRDRADEIAAMDASNVVLANRLYALQDESAAAQAAAQAQVQAIEAIKSAASGLLGDVSAAMGVLQRVATAEKDLTSKAHQLTMKHLQAQMDVSTTLVAEHKALSSLATSTISQMNIAGTEATDRATAQEQLRSALAIAKAGGPLPSAESMRGPLGILAKDASNLFATMQDYQSDFYRTQGEIAELGALSDKALSVEEKMLASLTSQKNLAQAAYEAEIERLDAILAEAQLEIDILNGINTNGLTIVQALEAVRLAILAANANPLTAASASITDAYKSALGRAPDAAGLEYFQDRAAAGGSIKDIVSAIKNSPEAKVQAMYQSLFGRTGDAGGIAYWTNALAGGMSETTARDLMMQSDEYKKNLRGFAVGTNQVPFDMPAMIHKDERIIPAADNRALMARLQNPAANNDALLAELRLLRQQVEQLRAAAQKTADGTHQIVASSGQLADQFDKVSAGGNSLLMEVIPA